MSAQLTKEEWGLIRDRLKQLHNSVYLQIDGFEVNLMLSQVSQFRNAIAVHIDGWLRGEWFIDAGGDAEPEQARRFFPLKTHHSFSAQERKRAEKKIGKRFVKKYMSQKYQHRGVYWDSFGALKKHLLAENSSIQLIQNKRPTLGATE